MSHRPVLWISKRTIGLIAILVLALAAAIVLLPRQNADAPILDPARRIARALATQDLYLRPDEYKADLTWDAYQQLLAVAPSYQTQNAHAPREANTTFAQYGAVLVLDRGYFGDSVTALVQVIVKKDNGPTLVEIQLPMQPDGTASSPTWKVGPNITTLLKGTVQIAAERSK